MRQKLQPYFLLAFLGGVLLLSFFILRPFLEALILAAVFAILFYPIQLRILKLMPNWKSTAALLTSVIVVLFIFLPLVAGGIQIAKEARHLYTSFSLSPYLGLLKKAQVSFGHLHHRFPRIQMSSLSIDSYAKQAVNWVFAHLGGAFSNIVKILIGTLVFFFALFYFLRDGKALEKMVVHLSPLGHKDTQTILNKLKLAINSVVKGQLTIAMVQGVLSVIGFSIFHVPNALLWGMMAGISALIPGVGTSLVMGPVVIYLFATGNTMNAVGLAIWGSVGVGTIDNFLAAKLVGSRMQLPPFVVFLSVLGGLSFFGALGFLLGPLTLTLLLELVGIYSSLIKRDSNNEIISFK